MLSTTLNYGEDRMCWFFSKKKKQQNKLTEQLLEENIKRIQEANRGIKNAADKSESDKDRPDYTRRIYDLTGGGKK